MSDILARRQTHFVLWCPAAPVDPPALIIGQIQHGNPPTFQQLTHQAMQQVLNAGGAVEGLWALDASTLGLTDGETYHSGSRWITGCQAAPVAFRRPTPWLRQ